MSLIPPFLSVNTSSVYKPSAFGATKPIVTLTGDRFTRIQFSGQFDTSWNLKPLELKLTTLPPFAKLIIGSQTPPSDILPAGTAYLQIPGLQPKQGVFTRLRSGDILYKPFGNNQDAISVQTSESPVAIPEKTGQKCSPGNRLLLNGNQILLIPPLALEALAQALESLQPEQSVPVGRAYINGDTRVSENHGIFSRNEMGELFYKSLGLNSDFVYRNGAEDPHQTQGIPKNTPISFKPGDVFALCDLYPLPMTEAILNGPVKK